VSGPQLKWGGAIKFCEWRVQENLSKIEARLQRTGSAFVGVGFELNGQIGWAIKIAKDSPSTDLVASDTKDQIQTI